MVHYEPVYSGQECPYEFSYNYPICKNDNATIANTVDYMMPAIQSDLLKGYVDFITFEFKDFMESEILSKTNYENVFTELSELRKQVLQQEEINAYKTYYTKKKKLFRLSSFLEKVDTKKIKGKANDFSKEKTVESVIPLITASGENKCIHAYLLIWNR